MLYLDDEHIPEDNVDWDDIIETIAEAVDILHAGDFSQPVKPYLRYRDKANRIIAMPAFMGGQVNMAGIKWIASFPGNLVKGMPRAHSVTILNEADTGKPCCIINTNRVSAIRTAGVTGFLLRELLRLRQPGGRSLDVGITGLGPIGIRHLEMLAQVAGDNIRCCRLFDISPGLRPPVPAAIAGCTRIVSSWQEAYADADIFITCTVASARYIDLPPKAASLHLNVSLRDYTIDAMKAMDHLVVDNWEEVCRENTDIENMHLSAGLKEKDVCALSDPAFYTRLESFGSDSTVMFNPMGMAVFDIATANYFFRKAGHDYDRLRPARRSEV